MSGNSVNFGDKKIQKKSKKLFKIDEIDVDKLLVSQKETYGKNESIKYFIGYSDNDVIKPLCIMLSQINRRALIEALIAILKCVF